MKEIVVPAELPATYTAYKAQQKRWTQGWVQLQRMHLATLLFRFQCSWLRRIHLVYHMCISWQWPAWAIWTSMLPFLIYTDHWFGPLGIAVGASLYLLPASLWVVVTATVASLETKHTYSESITPSAFLKRLGRIVPHTVINAGMLPHQFSSFGEGLFGPLHSEFERTPKTASVTPTSSDTGPGERPREVARRAETGKTTDGVKIHWPYALAEASYVVSQFAWAVLFVADGLLLPAIGAGFLAACVVYSGFFYGDHAGKVCFIFDRSRLRFFGQRRTGAGYRPAERATSSHRPRTSDPPWIAKNTNTTAGQAPDHTRHELTHVPTAEFRSRVFLDSPDTTAAHRR